MHHHASLRINKGICKVSHVTVTSDSTLANQLTHTDCLEVHFLQECVTHEQKFVRTYSYVSVIKPYVTRVRFFLSSEKVERVSNVAT